MFESALSVIALMYKPDLSADSYAKGLLNQWKCNSCGYTGLFFPEYTAEDVKKIKEKNP